jgi:hypothetical protein
MKRERRRNLWLSTILATTAAVVGGSQSVYGQPACTDSPIVQWAVADGGNDHFYQGVCACTVCDGSDGITWADAKAAAEARSGHVSAVARAAAAHAARTGCTP